MTIIDKCAKLAGGLAIALSLGAPLALGATPATAAGYGNDHGQYDRSQNDRGQYDRGDRDRNDRDHFRYGYDDRAYGDRFHMPPMMFERMSYRPHHGWNYHRGHWAWGRDHWMWIGGDWSSR